MASLLGLFGQQRLMWAAILLVGTLLIFFVHAPVIPVVIGCLAIPAINALRSRFQRRA